MPGIMLNLKKKINNFSFPVLLMKFAHLLEDIGGKLFSPGNQLVSLEEAFLLSKLISLLNTVIFLLVFMRIL